MKREDVKGIFAEATDEQLDKIMRLHGSDIEKYKGDLSNLKTELTNKKEAFEQMNSELEKLKESQAGAEDYKAKLEQLQADIAEKEKTEREAREKAEREETILNRYNAAAVGKDGKPLEWSHEAIRADYLRKFTEALGNKEYEGKSDAEIFHSLTKDDSAAFLVPQAQAVYGGAGSVSEEMDDAKINAIMGIK